MKYKISKEEKKVLINKYKDEYGFNEEEAKELLQEMSKEIT